MSTNELDIHFKKLTFRIPKLQKEVENFINKFENYNLSLDLCLENEANARY